MPLPDADEHYPIVLPNGERHLGTVLLKPILDHPNISVGEYTYAHDSSMPDDYAARLAPYLFPGAPEKLTIGKFCQIAEGVRFITGSANHAMDGLSTFPFAAFDPNRIADCLATTAKSGHVVVGHDCWFGRDALLLPDTHLGNGVIVGARAVVSGAVPDYAIVAGNPARMVRRRFSDTDIDRLNRLAWWDWPVDQINAAIEIIEASDLEALERFTNANSI